MAPLASPAAAMAPALPPLARRGASPADDQPLDRHLLAVARRSRRYAGAWGGPEAYAAGLWHDLGKYWDKYQSYLLLGGARGSVTHSTAGALHVLDRLRADRHPAAIDRIGRMPTRAAAMMMAILAHHGRLPDRSRFEERLGLTNPGADFPGLAEYRGALQGGPPARILDHPAFDGFDHSREGHPLFARMLLSVLVDADRTDAAGRKATRLRSMASLKAGFDLHGARLARKAGNPPSDIDALRSEVLAACLARASDPPGCFALDAPTGFGKTFSSLGFALEHARLHGMDRIIYVAPFLTAIEQTAAAFREALGKRSRFLVLEAHSTAERDAARAEDGLAAGADEVAVTVRDKLRENWEARVIVTSNVQFLEGLHAHDAGRCRKLHRIANAVVLLDEPQSIPVSLFAPTVDTLRELVRSYGTTLLFITATQPAFRHDPNKFPQGFARIEPLLADGLLARLRAASSARVRVTLPPGWVDVSLDQVADDVAREERSTLCIVNTRKDAAALHEAVVRLAAPGTVVRHLSASMCSDHRSAVLADVRRCLRDGICVKVISTQVVEAGIDIDLPVVMRAMAGLDSLIQSAGRCNRDGKLDHGDFRVFSLEGGVPHMFRTVASVTRTLLEGGAGLFDPATAEAYYTRVRDMSDKGERLLQEQEDWNLTTVGVEYRLIEPTLTLVVPYGSRGQRTVARLLARTDAPPAPGGQGAAFAGLSGITVSLRAAAAAALVLTGRARECGGFGLLVAVQEGDVPYDPAIGLRLAGADPVLTERDAREPGAGASGP